MSNIEATTIALPPWFVPGNAPVAEQLNGVSDAARGGDPSALVVRRNMAKLKHGAAGITSLEEIVGDSSDEPTCGGWRSAPSPKARCGRRLGAIRDINRAMDWQPSRRGCDHGGGPGDPEAASIPKRGARVLPSTASASAVLLRERNRITRCASCRCRARRRRLPRGEKPQGRTAFLD